MGTYIFITQEGKTYQPNSVSADPDIENCQVIGFAKGADREQAFENLIKENAYLLDTDFNEIICVELKNEDYYKNVKCFYLNAHKKYDPIDTAV